MILADSRVPPYRAVVAAARAASSELVLVDQGAADWEAQWSQAAPEAVIAVGPQALSFAKGKAADATIVYCMVLGAVPDGRTTGVLFEVSATQQLTTFRKLAPERKRIGVLYEPQMSGNFVRDASKVATGLGLSLVTREVTDAKEIRNIAGGMLEQVDALWLLPDPKLMTGDVFRYLLSLMTERKVAVYGFLENFTQAGALASVSPDFAEIGRVSVRLLVEAVGKKKTGVPAPVASPGALSINLRVAQLLGISPPADVLDRAGQVFR